jgi:hypothetical protein
MNLAETLEQLVSSLGEGGISALKEGYSWCRRSVEFDDAPDPFDDELLFAAPFGIREALQIRFQIVG